MIVYFTVYFIVDCTDDLAYLIPMFSLGSRFLYFHGSISCSTCFKSTKSKKPDEKINTEWAKVLSFVWEKVLFYTNVTFLITNLFRNIFQTLGVIDLITLLHVRNSDAKKNLNSWKKYFLAWDPRPWNLRPGTQDLRS